jgi:Flp pilus assembly protein TadB
VVLLCLKAAVRRAATSEPAVCSRDIAWILLIQPRKQQQPATVMHRVLETMAARRRDPEWWSDMSGARKYAFIQSQALFWGSYAVAAYLVFTNFGLAAGLVLVVPMLLLLTWIVIVMRRRYKRQFPNGRRRDD